MRLFLVLSLAALLSACSPPRIIVLNDPLDARQHNDLGVAYEGRGEAELAAREYQQAARLDKSWARPLVNLGNVRAAAGDFSAAEQSYRQALEREADNSEALNNLAWVVLQSAEPLRALPIAERAVTLAPAEPVFWDTLADIQTALGRPAAARESLNRALGLAGGEDFRKRLLEKRDRLGEP
ncbi:hypothetical protein DESUT3_31650 [Desulfuromonas versatilis]|uniref:Tetratricopeptide repeat protein n=1 Tax=Desulfuromonas versatilis TaxID=2802975 RepID=A0ABN6E1B8_9BACT|nr:tetratricopeptide repeat protein [Desulfuromonas versatilis]BCR06096.1 hypothetical protein DESUT3_31650 [Desulfuromonas versatilis]